MPAANVGALHPFLTPFPNPDIETEWNLLADETGAPPWLRPSWFRIWRASFAASDPLAIVGTRLDGRLHGLGVFIRRRGRLYAAANFHTPWFGIVALNNAARRAVVTAALDSGVWSVTFRGLCAGSDDHQVLEQLALERRALVSTYVYERSPYVGRPDDWDVFLASRLPRQALRELGRCQRRLQERGAVAFDWITPSRAEVEQLVRHGFEIEASGWKGRRGTAILSSPATTRFYTELGEWAAAEGWLRLGFLRVDDQRIAFDFAIQSSSTVWFLKGGIHEEFRRFGPGILLLVEELRRAFATGAREADLLGGDEPFKLRLADGTRGRARVDLLANTFRGHALSLERRAAWATRAAGRRMRRRARRRKSA